MDFASAAVRSYASIEQGKQENAIQRYNAKVAEYQGQMEAKTKQLQARRHRRDARIAAARNRGLWAGKSGLTFAGSPLDALAENAEQAEIDALMIEREGRIAIEESRREAALHRIGGKVAKRAGKYEATASLLKGSADDAKKITGFFSKFGKGGA